MPRQNTKNQCIEQHAAKSWVKRKPEGHSYFAMVPVYLLLHKSVTHTELRVFACLAAHANKHGRVYITRNRIAEMCGFISNGKPNAEYISRMLGKSGSLVKLGFVTNLGQRGFDECCEYQLAVPDSEKMQPYMLREVTDRYSETYEEEKQKAVAKKKIKKIRKLAGETPEVIEYDDEPLNREDVLFDLQLWNEGFDRIFPDAVYDAFDIEIPAVRKPAEE